MNVMMFGSYANKFYKGDGITKKLEEQILFSEGHKFAQLKMLICNARETLKSS